MKPFDHLAAMAVFAKVVEENGFSSAARALGMSRSAVSKEVRALEDRLGVRLLNRTTRRLHLTELGAVFYERCRRILAEAEAAEIAVSRLHGDPRGTLRVNAPVSFGVRHLAPALTGFMRRYPELSVDLSFTDRFVDLVEEGYDVVVRIARLPDSALIARRLCDSRRVVCASPAYWRARSRPRHPTELVAHECLGYAYLAEGREWRFRGPEGAVAVRPSGRFTANNGDALRAAALAGLGVALLPTFIVGEDLRRGRLETVLEEFEPEPAGIYAVWPHARHLAAKVRVFVDFLAARFAPPPPWES